MSDGYGQANPFDEGHLDGTGFGMGLGHGHGSEDYRDHTPMGEGDYYGYLRAPGSGSSYGIGNRRADGDGRTADERRQ